MLGNEARGLQLFRSGKRNMACGYSDTTCGAGAEGARAFAGATVCRRANVPGELKAANMLGPIAGAVGGCIFLHVCIVSKDSCGGEP